MSLRRRFFAKISPGPGACVDWTGAKTDKGYGRISFEGRPISATHASWFLKYGRWPTEHMLHSCDRPQCVNPEHLFEGDALDNARDRDTKGRHRTLSGDAAPWTRLTGLEVSEIVALTDSRMSNKQIGALFGVGEVYVSSLRHGRYRTRAAGATRKPRNARQYVVGGERLTIAEIAARAGVTGSTISDRIARGIEGDGLLAGKHTCPRKPYVRRK